MTVSVAESEGILSPQLCRMITPPGWKVMHYPAEAVSLEELIALIEALQKGFADAYAGYLAKVQGFATPPLIGERWPRDGYFLPSVEVFMQEARQRSAPATLAAILEAGKEVSGEGEAEETGPEP